MTEAYEQTCIRPEAVGKMTFSTIFGTFQSWVMQMGDCNAPSTFQRLMTIRFWDFLGRFVHVYLDDIFIYSQSIQEHIEHIMKVLQWLRESQFYLSRSKLDLFSDKSVSLCHPLLYCPPQSLFLFPTHLWHPSIHPCPPCLTLRPYVPCFTDVCFHATMILSPLA